MASALFPIKVAATRSMTRNRFSILILALILTLLGSGSGRALDASTGDLPLPQATGLLAKLRDDVPAERALPLFSSLGLHAERRIPRIGVWVLGKPAGSAQEAVHILAGHPDVHWVEPNGWVHASGIDPDDNYYQAQQDALRLIGLPEAWVFAQGDAIPIAVLDTGVALGHDDLDDRIWINSGEIENNNLDDDKNGYVDDVIGWDFVGDDALPQDDDAHGSHVAGIAAAETDNGIGIAGVTWENPIMAVKVLNDNGDGSWEDVAAGIVYAADNGARVLNLSFGGETSSQTIEDAVSYARTQGCLIVAAAGNDLIQPAPVEYPAALDGVLAVAATTNADDPWAYSNRGPEVDVAAPGVDIFSTGSPTGYYVSSGTSMATPHVSGLAALIWSLQPDLTADQVAGAITSTARDVYTLGWDQRSGWGRIDAATAILTIVQPQIDLTADPASFLVGTGSSILSATVTYSQSLPVPDALSVSFSSTLGDLVPQIALTHNGVATVTLSSSQPGEAFVTAEVGADFQDWTTVDVIHLQLFLPLVQRQFP